MRRWFRSLAIVVSQWTHGWHLREPEIAVAWLAGSSLLLAAVIVDLLAPWPYVMTPLYAVPVLLAAQRLPARQVFAAAGAVLVVNVTCSIVQDMPGTVWPLYTVGLGLTCYLAIRFAQQRQQTARRAQEAETARQRLEQFMGMVAHEHRNALSGLLVNAELLGLQQEHQSSALDQQALVGITNAAGRLQRLADDLQDARELSMGRFTVHLEPTDLVAVAQEIIATLQPSTERHQLQLEAPNELLGDWDGDRLGQLLANLVSNAIKYAPDGGEVRILLRAVPGQVLLQVTDPGPGIPLEHQGRLFQPFARLGGPQEVGGSGLGLFIARGIAEAHGGAIGVKSEPGKGSTFWVMLPRTSKLRSAV